MSTAIDIPPNSTDHPVSSLPRWGVLGFTLLIALTPAMPHFSIPHLPLSVDDLTTVAAACVGLLVVVRTGVWRDLRWRRAPEAYALAAMIPFTLLAAVHAGSLRSVATGPARWALNALVIALAYLLLRTPRDGRRMLQALVCVATFEAAFGVILYLLRWPGPRKYYWKPPWDLFGVSATGGPDRVFLWARITGTTGMAATFIAGFFALAVPIAVGLAMSSRGRSRWLWCGASVIVFAGLLLTLSRTPIGLATLAVVALLLAAARPRVWIPVLALIAVVFVATPLRSRMTDVDNDRLALWSASWRMFRDHWFFGVGPGRYLEYLEQYKDTPYGVAGSTPHNSLLYVAAESGVVAALALATAIALSFRFLRSRQPLILGPMLGLAAFMIDAMTTNLYAIPSIAIAAWMIAPAVATFFTRPPSASSLGGLPLPTPAEARARSVVVESTAPPPDAESRPSTPATLE